MDKVKSDTDVQFLIIDELRKLLNMAHDGKLKAIAVAYIDGKGDGKTFSTNMASYRFPLIAIDTLHQHQLLHDADKSIRDDLVVYDTYKPDTKLQ